MTKLRSTQNMPFLTTCQPSCPALPGILPAALPRPPVSRSDILPANLCGTWQKEVPALPFQNRDPCREIHLHTLPDQKTMPRNGIISLKSIVPGTPERIQQKKNGSSFFQLFPDFPNHSVFPAEVIFTDHNTMVFLQIIKAFCKPDIVPSGKILPSLLPGHLISPDIHHLIIALVVSRQCGDTVIQTKQGCLFFNPFYFFDGYVNHW